MAWFRDTFNAVGDFLDWWEGKVLGPLSPAYKPSSKSGQSSHRSERPPTPPVQLQTRGTFQGDLILVVGRTGSGKSSVVNMLKGEQVVAVGDVASTTRWFEGVPLTLSRRTITLVDSPGIGEAFTDANYNEEILTWYRQNERSVSCILLVLQADAKAHADDERLLKNLRCVADKPLLIALNQVDKIKPARDVIVDNTWTEYRARNNLKSIHIGEKLEVITEQFRRTSQPSEVVPITSEAGHSFNKEHLVSAMLNLLPRRW